LGLAIKSANDVDSPLPLGELTYEIYNEMSQTKYSNLDFSSVLDYLRNTTKE
jgi:3-hydroxyisobutyrate dehydrogenase-like beta-hydroxyacid dehydrogenase